MTTEPEEHDRIYEMGCKTAWLGLLRQAMRELGDETPSEAKLVAERAAAIATLRSVCSEYGDNDWDDDLNLSDIIDKHLRRHLE